MEVAVNTPSRTLEAPLRDKKGSSHLARQSHRAPPRFHRGEIKLRRRPSSFTADSLTHASVHVPWLPAVQSAT